VIMGTHPAMHDDTMTARIRTLGAHFTSGLPS
jgi:hypothetical protein